MPGFDGTGPRGFGPMTGWGRGYCPEPAGYVRPRYGIFRGYGAGGGRGWRNRYWATGVPRWAWWRKAPRLESQLTAQEEMEALQEDANYLERELDRVRKDIDRLKKNETEKK